MKRFVHISALIVLLSCGFNICAQDRSEVMKQLLSAPAPTPRTIETSEKKKRRPPKFYDMDNFPPDDAPIEDCAKLYCADKPGNGP